MTGYNDPAFSFTEADGQTSYPGLTKREYFAALAMQGMLASGVVITDSAFAHDAVVLADALIAALNGEGQADA